MVCGPGGVGSVNINRRYVISVRLRAVSTSLVFPCLGSRAPAFVMSFPRLDELKSRNRDFTSVYSYTNYQNDKNTIIIPNTLYCFRKSETNNKSFKTAPILPICVFEDHSRAVKNKIVT